MTDNAGVLQDLSDSWRHRNDPPPEAPKTKTAGGRKPSAPAPSKDDGQDSTTTQG